MIINHNITALNTHRQLAVNTANTSKNIEKLSSGLRINRAGDDAAGLAISEKMRGQIRGLDQASRNAQDGISLIQTAEGALNETHSILQRMRELAVQAGNETNASSDLKEIQKEINQLTSEINRVSNTTEFNTKKLLNGGKEDMALTGKVGAAAITAVTEVKGVSTVDLTALGAGETVTIDGQIINFTTDAAGTAAAMNANSTLTGKYTITEAAGVVTLTQNVGSATAAAITSSDTTVAGTVTNPTTGVAGVAAKAEELGEFKFDLDVANLADGQVLTVGIDKFTFKKDGTGDFKDAATLTTAVAGKGNYTLTIADNVATLKQAVGKGSDAAAPNVSLTTAGQDGTKFSATLQVGANKNQTMQIDVNDMGAKALGLTTTTVKEGLEITNGTNNTSIGSALNIQDKTSAATAIETINKAIETVSGERSKLGAFQNRLEHTINNLGTSSENLTAAESRIRDVDMAKEMMQQTKNSILAQAAQAMLAQANQQPQGVLQLLR